MIVAQVGDFVGNLPMGEFMRGVFHAIGKNGDDNLLGALVAAHFFEAGVKVVEGLSDGVEQGSGTARNEGCGVELHKLGDGNGGAGDFILVVEEDECETGIGRGFLLIMEELVEASDGGFEVGLHRAGAIEDEGDFGGECFHNGRIIKDGVGHRRGYAKNNFFAFFCENGHAEGPCLRRFSKEVAIQRTSIFNGKIDEFSRDDDDLKNFFTLEMSGKFFISTGRSFDAGTFGIF